MTRPLYEAPLIRRTITQEEVSEGIARARHLRAEAYADVFSAIIGKVGGMVRRLHRPSLWPSSSFSH